MQSQGLGNSTTPVCRVAMNFFVIPMIQLDVQGRHLDTEMLLTYLFAVEFLKRFSLRQQNGEEAPISEEVPQ